MSLKNVLGDIALEDTQLDLLGQFNSIFSRILEKRFSDLEEVRYDIPATKVLRANNSIYIGVAPDGTLTTDLAWDVVRFYFNASSVPERARIRKGIAWDDRTTGW